MKLRGYITIFCLLLFAIGISVTSCLNDKAAKKAESTTEKSKAEKSIEESASGESVENPGSETSVETSRSQAPDASQNLPTVPAFKAKNLLDGKDISMEDFKGHVLIIDFWATWCPPCRREIPAFTELQEEYADKKFTVIGMSVDRTGEGVVKKFMQDYKVNYPMVMVNGKMQRDFERAIGSPIRYIPTTLVVNRNGGIVSVHVGGKTKETFEKEIKELL